jgi:hypothetical protein
MSEEPVTLEFIGRQLHAVLAEVASFRDDMRVLTEIVMRLESSHHRLAEQVSAMVRQHQRFNDRLRSLEDERFERQFALVDERLRALEGKDARR